ncbi:hypothetical protein PXNS11_350002 [Stutzerimonas xanthomarina]|nr:hypothetical protein PXNS11_350002 [Stutzerimonas xanthomarina]
MAKHLGVPRPGQRGLDFSAGQYAILVGIGDIVESSERYDWTAIGFADLRPVVVLFVCA